jgi:hypothetical protein
MAEVHEHHPKWHATHHGAGKFHIWSALVHNAVGCKANDGPWWHKKHRCSLMGRTRPMLAARNGDLRIIIHRRPSDRPAPGSEIKYFHLKANGRALHKGANTPEVAIKHL